MKTNGWLLAGLACLLLGLGVFTSDATLETVITAALPDIFHDRVVMGPYYLAGGKRCIVSVLVPGEMHRVRVLLWDLATGKVEDFIRGIEAVPVSVRPHIGADGFRYLWILDPKRGSWLVRGDPDGNLMDRIQLATFAVQDYAVDPAGRIYTAHLRRGPVLRSGEPMVSAFDARGRLLWQAIDVREVIMDFLYIPGPPVIRVVNHRIYVASGNRLFVLDPDGRVRAHINLALARDEAQVQNFAVTSGGRILALVATTAPYVVPPGEPEPEGQRLVVFGRDGTRLDAYLLVAPQVGPPTTFHDVDATGRLLWWSLDQAGIVRLPRPRRTRRQRT